MASRATMVVMASAVSDPKALAMNAGTRLMPADKGNAKRNKRKEVPTGSYPVGRRKEDDIALEHGVSETKNNFSLLLERLADEHDRFVKDNSRLQAECSELRTSLGMDMDHHLVVRSDNKAVPTLLRDAGEADKPSSPPVKPSQEPPWMPGMVPETDAASVDRQCSPISDAASVEDEEEESELSSRKQQFMKRLSFTSSHHSSENSKPNSDAEISETAIVQCADEEEKAPKLTLTHTKTKSNVNSHQFTSQERWKVREVGPKSPSAQSKNPSLAFGEMRSTCSSGMSRQKTYEAEAEEEEEGTAPKVATYDGVLRKFISMPTAPKRVAWDLSGGVLIVYDLITIPLRVFDPPDTSFTIFMDWFALIFWTMNVGASLTVAFFREGVIEMDPKRILANYLKCWFWIDMAVIGPDWGFTIVQAAMGTSSDAGDSVKLLRVLRLVRCMRLLRLAKLKWIVAAIKDRIDNESLDILFNIVKMILCLIAVNHYVGCFWFATTLLDAGSKWTEVHHFDNDQWSYQYVTSFHWAITQFTPSSMHVQPQNMVERLFAITVVIFGLVGFSYLVGSITGSLTELRRMKEEASKQFWTLRRFLKRAQISIELRLRIEKYVEHACLVQKSAINTVNLPVLKLLTQQLQNELNCAMYMHSLEVHPLFLWLIETSPTATQRIATEGLSRQLLARSEAVFGMGEFASHLSFVTVGRLHYIRTFPDEPDHREFVDRGEDWITEQALWMPKWETLGDLVALSVSELVHVSSKGFADAIHRTPAVHQRVCQYAANFIAYVNNMSREDLSDICQGDIVADEIRQMLYAQEDETPSETPEADDLQRPRVRQSYISDGSALSKSLSHRLRRTLVG